MWAETLMAFGIGAILALAVAALVRFATEPRRGRRRPLADRIAEAKALPRGARLIALARLARETGTPLPEDIRDALYRALPEAEETVLSSRLETALSGR